MIEAEGLVQRYRRGTTPALDRVSLTVNEGEVFGVLGADGAGKTSLLRILAGLQPPNAGTARIDGHDVMGDRGPLRGFVAYLPQSPPLPRDRTLDAYLDMWARIEGMTKDRREERREALFGTLGLTEVAGERVTDTTTYAQRRLFLAVTLLTDPRVLLLDEPMGGLSPADRSAFLDRLREVAAGKTILIATSILANLQPICARIMTLADGHGSLAYETSVLLRAVGEAHHARVFVDPGVPAATATPVLRSVPGVLDVRETPPVMTLFVEPGVFDAEGLRRVLSENGMEARSIRRTEIVLGDIVRTLMRKEGR